MFSNTNGVVTSAIKRAFAAPEPLGAIDAMLARRAPAYTGFAKEPR